MMKEFFKDGEIRSAIAISLVILSVVVSILIFYAVATLTRFDCYKQESHRSAAEVMLMCGNA